MVPPRPVIAIFLPFRLSKVLYGPRLMSQYEILSEENQIARVGNPLNVAFTDAGPTPAWKSISPCTSAGGTSAEFMRMISISRPLAGKIPQSRAAKSGSAVIVNAALEILVFPRRSWALPATVSDNTRPLKAAKCINEKESRGDRFVIVLLWVMPKELSFGLACTIKAHAVQF